MALGLDTCLKEFEFIALNAFIAFNAFQVLKWFSLLLEVTLHM